MRTVCLCLVFVTLCACEGANPVRPAGSNVSLPIPPSPPGIDVTGVVADPSSQEPIPGATVEWAGAAEAWGDRGGVLTDAAGAYRIHVALLAGPGSANVSFFMRASKDGYIDSVKTVTLVQGLTVNFGLTRNVPSGVYRVTLTASSSCAADLPPIARERTYNATLLPGGGIAWSGPTLGSPQGHRTISSGALNGDAFSFSVDVERDPQSDDFHGLWDVLGNGSYVNISGKGTGSVGGAQITGTFDGLFAFYEPFVPPDPNVLIVGHYCSARDHRFVFVQQ